MVLAATLSFYHLEVLGDGNLYYTAAVEAMLDSPAHFFFIAAEPGGSVTVDKPPLGLWLQGLSALVFGVNGFAVMLPQILASVLSVPLVYSMTRHTFGVWAGLLAGFALAVTPVGVAVARNNTMDYTLVLALLLAAYAFLRATETGRWRWLLVGALMVGLAFNIKMLQAFLPLPAFYAVYFLGARVHWARKIIHLTAATVVIVAVSFAWVVAVDLVPPENRPYIGSSDGNTVMELVFGYNGLNRLFGGGGAAATGAQNQTPPTLPNILPPQLGSETGSPGLTRLFEQPLVNEASWLLPFALFSMALVVFAYPIRLSRHTWFEVVAEHQAFILWGGWLLMSVVFFSVARFFHAYYLVMLAPPVAILTAMGAATVYRLVRQTPKRLIYIGVLMAGITIVTLWFQAVTVNGYINTAWWLIIPVIIAGFALVVLFLIAFDSGLQAWLGPTIAALMVALLITPAVWSALTTLDTKPDINLPHAYDGEPHNASGRDVNNAATDVDETLITYLTANTDAEARYLMAVPSSHIGAAYVLATGRGVLYMGGFGGGDDVIDADGLAQLIATDDLRYIVWDGGRGQPGGSPSAVKVAIGAWLQSACSIETEVTLNLRMRQSPPGMPAGMQPPSGSGGQMGATLYDCG